MGAALTAALVSGGPALSTPVQGAAAAGGGLTVTNVAVGGGIGYGLYRLGKWWWGR